MLSSLCLLIVCCVAASTRRFINVSVSVVRGWIFQPRSRMVWPLLTVNYQYRYALSGARSRRNASTRVPNTDYLACNMLNQFTLCEGCKAIVFSLANNIARDQMNCGWKDVLNLGIRPSVMITWIIDQFHSTRSPLTLGAFNVNNFLSPCRSRCKQQVQCTWLSLVHLLLFDHL
jgi:hypothetical protein